MATNKNLLECLKCYDALILTDIARKIIWASHGFKQLTGYSVVEAVGRKLSFLQGPETNTKTLKMLNKKLMQFQSVTANLVNYKKNGMPYNCEVSIEPVFGKANEPEYFIVFEKEVSIL